MYLVDKIYGHQCIIVIIQIYALRCSHQISISSFTIRHPSFS
jgi:hypothetical protein